MPRVKGQECRFAGDGDGVRDQPAATPRQCQQWSSSPGTAMPPPTNTAAGAGSSAEPRAPRRCGRSVRARPAARHCWRSGRRARHRARSRPRAMPRPDRSHSIATLPAPAPTSQSSSPSQGARAARVTARTSALVNWPSCSKASSGRPGTHGQRVRDRGRQFDREQVEVGEAVPAEVEAAVAVDQAAPPGRPDLPAPPSGWRRSRHPPGSGRSHRAHRRHRSGRAGGGRAGGGGAGRPTGRPWAVTAWTSSSGQPRRLHASWKAETWGRIADLGGGTWRSSKRPIPYQSGSPVARTATCRGRSARSVRQRVGEGRAPGQPPRPSCRDHGECRSPPTRTSAAAIARRALPAQTVQAVGADADQCEPGHAAG